MTVTLLVIAAFGTFYGIPCILLYAAITKARREGRLYRKYSRADHELHKYRQEIRRDRKKYIKIKNSINQ